MYIDPVDIELVSEAAHEGWMQGKSGQGIASRKSEWGEELMVSYSKLSERAKDLDRSTVRAVLEAMDRAGYEIVPPR